MTGLDPVHNVIVEIATIITDDDLNVVAEGPDLVIHATTEQLSHMGDFVTQMHTNSGLLPLIVSSTITLADAESQTLAFIRAHVSEPRSVPLCGNSIGTDRRFLQEYMPTLEDYFHYRNVDVSTIKELAKRWNPEALTSLKEKSSSHRALDDVRESIAELAHYRTSVFRDSGPKG